MLSHRVHTFRSFLLGLFAALLGVLSLAIASPAWAHDELIGASPSANAQVDAVPSAITMTFSGVLIDQPGATQVVVTDAAGTSLTAGTPTLDGTRLTQQLAGTASGPVTVIWRVVSSDGHPVSGQYTFTVAGAASDATPGATSTPATPATPGATASPSAAVPISADAGVPAFVWALLGIVALAALGGLVAVLVRRARATPED